VLVALMLWPISEGFLIERGWPRQLVRTVIPLAGCGVVALMQHRRSHTKRDDRHGRLVALVQGGGFRKIADYWV
jgi:hypothetical protein